MKRLLALFFLATAAAQGATNYMLGVNNTGAITIGTNWHGTQIVFSASTPVYVGTNRLATVADIVAGTVTNNQWRGDTDRIGAVASNGVPQSGGSFTAAYTIAWQFVAGQDAGPIRILGSDGTINQAGGDVLIEGGPSHDYKAGTVTIRGGSQAIGGIPSGSGGDVIITAGTSTGGIPGTVIISNGLYHGDASALTNMPLSGLRITNTPTAGQVLATSDGTNGYWKTASGGSVTLTTNLLLVLDSTVGDWFCLRNVSGPTTNNSVTPPVHAGYVTVDSRTFPYARMETALTNTWQTRTVVSRMVEVGEVATNVAAVRIVFPGSSAAATNTVNFLGPSSNVFASCVVTNATNYDLTASLFATNRRWHAQIHGYVPPAVGTNTGWLALLRVEFIKQ